MPSFSLPIFIQIFIALGISRIALIRFNLHFASCLRAFVKLLEAQLELQQRTPVRRAVA
jgi:hypothetical protein